MDEHKVFMKCAWRLMPFILLLYFINYIDRVNVGFAALTMNADLGFTPTTFGFGAGVLFWGYLLFQIPGNIIMQRIGARIWMMTILIVWGLISASTAFVRDPTTFYLVRFFLGVAEAGFFPGMLLYLTFWFPQAYLGRFVGVFMAGIPLSFIIGGPVSSLILEMDGVWGLRGWQWLFIIEGLPATLLAFAVPFMLPNNPTEAKWLTEGEKKVITSRIVREDRADKHDLFAALHDVRVITLGVALAFVQIGLYGTQLWVPQIVQSLGFSNLVNGFVTAIPFLCGAVAMVLWGHASDVAQDRIRYIVMPCLFAGASLFIAGLTDNYLIVLFGLTCGLVGLLALDGPLFSLPRTFLTGAAAASGIALLNSIGTLGRFIGPYIVGYLREETGGFAAGMIATAVSMALAAGIVVILGRMIAARSVHVAKEAARPAE
jgi:ACS family tartrate transporter-like MFS transporter